MASRAWGLIGRYLDRTGWPFHALAAWLCIFLLYAGTVTS